MSTNSGTESIKWYIGFDRPTCTWQAIEATKACNFQVFGTFYDELEALEALEKVRTDRRRRAS